MQVKRLIVGLLCAVFALTLSASAAPKNRITVSPADLQGWSTSETTAGGTVNFIKDPSSPAGNDAIQLTTNNTNDASAVLLHSANVSLSGITELSYFTKQISAPVSTAAPYYFLGVCLDGGTNADCESFTYLIYEPYWNGTVVSGVWQQWNVAAGQFWSTETYTDGACSVIAGAGGPPFYNLPELGGNCPNATVVSFGVGIGTYNPNYVVETDLINFNGTTYDFELKGNQKIK